MEKADLPGAMAEFRKAVSLDSKSTTGLHKSGLGTGQEWRPDRGGASVSKSAGAGAEQPRRAYESGCCFTGEGRRRRRAHPSSPCGCRHPTNANVQYELGQTLRQSGDLAGAIAAFERALQIDPELREGYYALGVALKQQSASTRRPGANPASPADDLYKHGQESAARGDLDAARQQLTEALGADEDSRGGAQFAGVRSRPAGRSYFRAGSFAARGRAPPRIRRGPLQFRRWIVVQRLAGGRNS